MSSVLCPIEFPATSDKLEISVFNALAAKIRMEHIGPRDIHQHDEDLGLKMDSWAIENLDSRQRRFFRFAKQFLLYGADSSFSFLCRH